ncbi:MAG: hypothetical protein H7Z37_05205 [Pyrinomonadaceae bacterium]|nr:hypothetical protein [Pyrinomonadaceae bacterium]
MSSENKTKYRFRKRLFLNKELNMPAFIVGIVEDTSFYKDEGESWKWGTIELSLGDCYRRVSFDFSMDTREERAASLYKIKRIAKIVNAVRDAIELEAKAINARETKLQKLETQNNAAQKKPNDAQTDAPNVKQNEISTIH